MGAKKCHKRGSLWLRQVTEGSGEAGWGLPGTPAPVQGSPLACVVVGECVLRSDRSSDPLRGWTFLCETS